MKKQPVKKEYFAVHPQDDDEVVNYYEGNEAESRAKFEAEVEGTDDPPIEANFDVWCMNNLQALDKATYHRNPTNDEIKFGHGALHYKDFPVVLYMGKNGKPKKWLVCPEDGLRYYR